MQQNLSRHWFYMEADPENCVKKTSSLLCAYVFCTSILLITILKLVKYVTENCVLVLCWESCYPQNRLYMSFSFILHFLKSSMT